MFLGDLKLSLRGFLFPIKASARRNRRGSRLANRSEAAEPRLLLTTFLVDSLGGGDFLTIQEAVNAAQINSEGDTVQIAPGTYMENVTIGSQIGGLQLIGLSGTGPNGEVGVVIDGSDGDGAVNTVSITPNFGGVIELQNLTVTGGRDGIQLRGSVNASRHTLLMSNISSTGNELSGLSAIFAGDVVVSDSTFTNNGHSGIYANTILSVATNNVVANQNGRDGLFVQVSGGLSATDSQFDGNLSEGIYAFDVDQVRILNSSFNDNSDNGLDLRENGEVVIDGSDVSRSGPLPTGGTIAGVYANLNQSFTVSNTTLLNNTAMGAALFNTMGTLTISGVTARGNAFAGISIRGLDGSPVPPTAVVEDSLFEGNVYRGINFEGIASATVSNTTVRNNGSTEIDVVIPGGGIRFGGDGDLTILRSEILNNKSLGAGGGIYVQGSQGELTQPGTGRVIVSESSVSGNLAETFGGGLYVATDRLELIDSTIASNVGGNNRLTAAGGGVFVSSTETDITNTTISQNQTAGSGGGLSVRNGNNPLRLVNSTIYANVAGVDPTASTKAGGGIDSGSGPILVLNTIVSGNMAPLNQAGEFILSNVRDPFQNVFSLGNNLNDNGQEANLFSGPGDIVGVDPELGTLQDNGGFTMTHALLNGSPALNHGAPDQNNPSPNLIPPTKDQRGFDRVGRLDIGAFENQRPIAVPDFASTLEDTPVVIDILGNDIEMDGETLIIERITGVEGGSVAQNSDGTVTFTPDLHFHGAAGFMYNVEDAVGNQSRTSVSLTVTPVNDAPEIADQSFTIEENSPVDTIVGQVQASDVDHAELEFSIIAGNLAGGFALSADGVLSVADSTVLDFETTSVFVLEVAVTDGVELVTAFVTVNLTDVFEVVTVDIDIDPNDAANRINLRKDRRIDVVLFATASFNPALIDIDSLRFGASGEEDSLSRQKKRQEPRVRFEDINGDGLLDMVASFDVGKTGLTAEDTEAVLTGRLLDGTEIIARQSIIVMDGNSKGRGKKR